MAIVKQVSVSADTTLVTTAETVVATLPGIFEGPGGSVINVEGYAQVTTGTAATAVTVRVRRGVDATGTLVGEGNVEALYAVAGSTEERNVYVADTPGEGGPYTYVLTLQQASATGNGTCVQASLSATAAGPGGT